MYVVLQQGRMTAADSKLSKQVTVFDKDALKGHQGIKIAHVKHFYSLMPLPSTAFTVKVDNLEGLNFRGF